MALVWRTVFADGRDGLPALARDRFADWMRSKGIEPDLPMSGSRVLPDGQEVFVGKAQDDVAGGRLDALRLGLRETNRNGTWTTTLTALDVPAPDGRQRWVWIDLDHVEPADGPAERIVPAAPRLVQQLLDPEHSHRDGVPLAAVPVPLEAAQDGQVAATVVLMSNRTVPVLVYACDRQVSVEDNHARAAALAKATAGVAVVLRLDPAALHAFRVLVGPELRLFPGEARTYLPGAGSDGDDPRRHRRLSAARLARHPASAARAVAGALSPASLAVRPPEVFTSLVSAYPGFRPADRIVLREDAITIGDSAPAQASPAVAAPAVPETAPAVPAGPSVAPTDRETALRDRLAQVAAQLARSAQTVDMLQNALAGAESELDRERARAAAVQSERDDALIELTGLLNDLSKERARVAWLERRLVDAGDHEAAYAPTEDSCPAEAGSFADVIALAAEHLDRVVVMEHTERTAVGLDEHDRSLVWSAKTWDALRALESFAAARSSEAGFAGDFQAWCERPSQGGLVIPSGMVAMRETNTVANRPAWRNARTFRVPDSVDPAGKVYMDAHIKIDNKNPAPRVHFHDDTAGTTGKIWVGYIGPHLPNTMTD